MTRSSFWSFRFVLLLACSVMPSATVFAATDGVERGRYIAHNVAGCMSCHSQRDFSFYSGPIVQGTEGQGSTIGYLNQDRFAPNITPTALSKWSDADLRKALVSGVGKKGTSLHSFLPHHSYSEMASADVDAVIAFLRTLAPLPDRPEASKFASAAPGAKSPSSKPVKAQAKPPVGTDKLASGKYLVTLAGCQFCHGEQLAGGHRFQTPGHEEVVSLNLASILKNEQTFASRFHAYASERARRLRSPEGSKNSVMPWTEFAHLSDADLSAIYTFLVTIQKPDEVKAASVKPSGSPTPSVGRQR